jgi:hypothetical protein
MQILGPAGEKIIIEERIRNAARWLIFKSIYIYLGLMGVTVYG